MPRQPLTPFTTETWAHCNSFPALSKSYSRASPQDSNLWDKRSCRINDRICAQLFKDASCLVGNVRPINIFSCAEQQPPLPTECFPDEYTFLASHSRLLFRVVGTLSISAEEPQPLSFKPGKFGVPTTVRLKIRYLPLDQTSKNTHCHSSSCLSRKVYPSSHDIISVEPQIREPSSRDALRSPVTAEVVKIGTCHTQRQHLTHGWSRHPNQV